jgi:hypothetical protein
VADDGVWYDTFVGEDIAEADLKGSAQRLSQFDIGDAGIHGIPAKLLC